MPVTSYFKSPILSNKLFASVTSVDFKVLSQHELVVCRGHRYHCHSECLLPLYFWPAVYNPATLSYPIRLYTDTWLLLGAQQFTVLILSGKRDQCAKSLIWAQARFPSSSISPDISSWHNGTFLRSDLFGNTCSFQVQGEITAVDNSTASMENERACWSSEPCF